MSKRSILSQYFYLGRATGMSIGVALLFTVLGWVGFGQTAFAESNQPDDPSVAIVVNTNVPSVKNDGRCSLIEAIDNANADAQPHADCPAGNGNDTITLPADATMILTTTHNLVDGGNGLPVITSTMTIVGNGTTLIRNNNVAPLFRFFDVMPSGNLSLNGLNLNNGRAGIDGSAILLFGGGAIYNQGTVSVRDSNASFNRASLGGAIYSIPVTGSLTLNNVTFSSNVADTSGGAIYSAGPATITGGIMRSNSAQTNGGAILNDSSFMSVLNTSLQSNISAATGAGITSRATMTNSHLLVRSADILDNVASINGGGIYNTANAGLTAQLDVQLSHISANRANSTAANQGLGGGILNGWGGAGSGGNAQANVSQSSVLDNVARMGGGIANIDAGGYLTRSAKITVSQSTLASNHALGDGNQGGVGGGLYNSNGDATVVNSTISGNLALGDDTTQGGRGGGIGNESSGVTTTLHVLNATIAFNQATQAGGGISVKQVVSPSASSMEIGNSLIVHNVLTTTSALTTTSGVAAHAASVQVIADSDSCALENGTTTSLGGNLEDHATCGFNSGTDLTNKTLALGPLASNGGPTFTHLITSNSFDGFAFDSGVDAICAAAPVSGVDQRGITRPQNDHCDRGAVELEIEAPLPPVIYFPQIYLLFIFPQ